MASLLSFAKQSPAAMAPVDLNTLLRTAIKLTQAQWQTNKIELHTDLDMEMPPVMGDSNQLLQVLVQILGNALYAADEAGNRTLTIATKLQSGIASIDISDCGAEETVRSEENVGKCSARSRFSQTSVRAGTQRMSGNLAAASRTNICGRTSGTPASPSASKFPSSLARRRKRRRRLLLQYRQYGNLNRSLELSASGVNVPASRTPHKCRDCRLPQNLLKRRDSLSRWAS